MRKHVPYPNRNDPYFAILCSMWATDSKPEDFMIYGKEDDGIDRTVTPELLPHLLIRAKG